MTALCVTDMSENGKRTESETEKVHLSTRPDVIKNLKLEKSFEHSFTLKWDAPIGASNVAKYKITISGNNEQAEEPDSAEIQGALYIFNYLFANEAAVCLQFCISDEGEDGPGFSRQSTLQNIKDFTSTFEIMGDKTQHTFAKLPERIGSGHSYDVTIVAITMSQRVDKNDHTSKNSGEICSLDVTERFMTRPLAPTNVRVGNKENPLEICWMKSMTPSGTYKA